MKITILYDNTSTSVDYQSDWGFSCLVQAYGKNILFDTGGNGKILLENMEKLDINPSDISDVFLSHCHFDHIGGLSYFLNANRDVTVHVPPSIRGIKWAKKVIEYPSPTQIFDNIYTTGELEDIEQSLLVKVGNDLVLLVGCAHPKPENIFKASHHFGIPNHIIGGFHDFNKFHLLKRFKLICPTHCTKYIKELEFLYKDKYVPGGVGRVIEIGEDK